MARKIRLTFNLSNGKEYTISLADPKATEELTPSVVNTAMTSMANVNVITVGGATLSTPKSADIYETTITDLPLA